MDGTDAVMQRNDQLLRGSTLLGRFNRYVGDPPSAEHFEVLADLDAVVDGILTDLAGWNLTTTDEALATALVERGAILTRHFSLMSIDVGLADLFEGNARTLDAFDVRQLTPQTAIPTGVVDLFRAAYPTGHPDVEIGSDDDIIRDVERAMSGVRLGPLMEASALVFDGARLVALVLVNRVPGDPPIGGPWVTDICRDPAPHYAGLGQALLIRALNACATAGDQIVSLAVTEGNDARRLYESLGFDVVATTRRVRLPG